MIEPELTPLQRLVLAYAAPSDRQVYAAVFALDNRCAGILRGTSETMLGQMRLAWWRDVMAKPKEQRPVGDPVVHALGVLQSEGCELAALTPIVDAWELLLVSEELTMAQVEEYAVQRAHVFTVIAQRVSREANIVQIAEAGKIWAIWDLARHASDPAMRSGLKEEIALKLQDMYRLNLERSLRPLSILLRLAAADVRNGTIEQTLMRPASAARIIWHGVSGL